MPMTKGARDLKRRLTPEPHLTQARLARELGVTQQAISAWLRGVARPDPERRAKLEELTGVAIADWDVDERESGPDVHAANGNASHAKASA